VYSADGQWLISGSSDGTVKLWRARSGKLQATISATEAEVRSVAISPGGDVLVAGLRYGTLKAWKWAKQEEQYNARAHESDVWSIALSPDGRTLTSGDGDWNKPGLIKLWDTASWRLRQTFATSAEVLSVACSPDGRTIAAGCADGRVTAWRIEAP
jgi:WD40 repeat protein